MCIEQKVEQYREKLIRIIELKKKLIDSEISLQKVMIELNLSQYEFKKLLNGELEEREAEVLALCNKIPAFIKNRDRSLKTFQKLLLQKDLTVKDFCNKEKLDEKKVYRALRGLNVERDIETERGIERALKTRIF
jgi:hypothetical protein|nr:MAG TPA: hypothetical protein [Caudoviricetes sp.]